MAARKPASRRPRRSKPVSDDFMESLKRYVRTEGKEYLRDGNITSVGIGYKQVDGKPTKEVAIQFTVDTKAVPEALDELETELIPPTITVDGVEVPTDVIQRTYKPAFKVVAERAADPRRTRIDPIVPGVSVAHTSETAGTIGCIVFDRQDGTPYILSNWHVLHGPDGEIGDAIVQPGPHDDNRVRRNRLGVLKRSHLGEAGDCAVASIEDRAFETEIFGLGVAVDRLGEPELGDLVVKSGRTTGVTHGMVTRVHTVAKLDYEDGAGERAIGGFEIGLDEDELPENGEITQGGDSGAAWLFRDADGEPTGVLAGLHFAGEGPTDPNEHALACYPRSVFDKLEITLSPPEPDEEAAASGGYAADFLRVRLTVPKLSPANGRDASKLNRSEVIPYTHFSLALSRRRRFAFWVAWNVDGARLRKYGRSGLRFGFDPRLPEECQVGEELYADNRLDRGHLARRADLVWGSDTEAKRANRESFLFTNIAPQMNNFNQSMLGGMWGRLEDALFEEVEVEDLRISLFGGPVFHDDDREYRGVQIPREFFKVLAYVADGDLSAKAFLLTQSLDQLELFELNPFKVFQVTLGEVEQRCGFRFPANLRAADSFAERLARRPEATGERQPLASLGEIDWG